MVGLVFTIISVSGIIRIATVSSVAAVIFVAPPATVAIVTGTITAVATLTVAVASLVAPSLVVSTCEPLVKGKMIVVFSFLFRFNLKRAVNDEQITNLVHRDHVGHHGFQSFQLVHYLVLVLLS